MLTFFLTDLRSRIVGVTPVIEIRDARSATTRLRALQARIDDLEPKSITLAEMVDRIEKANATADQLPTDLETLKEARETIEKLLKDVILDREKVGKFATDADTDKVTLSTRVKEAKGSLHAAAQPMPHQLVMA